MSGRSETFAKLNLHISRDTSQRKVNFYKRTFVSTKIKFEEISQSVNHTKSHLTSDHYTVVPENQIFLAIFTLDVTSAPSIPTKEMSNLFLVKGS